jgi:hypothetical protein
MNDLPSKPEGRPPVDKEAIFQKLKPYLQTGLSVNKACLEAQIPKSTVYDLIQNDDEFSEKISRAQQYLAIIYSNAIVTRLHGIIKKQNEGKILDVSDNIFLQWFGTRSRITREEFGERQDISLFDPETEIQRVKKLIEEASAKRNV